MAGHDLIDTRGELRIEPAGDGMPFDVLDQLIACGEHERARRERALRQVRERYWRC
ncbi:MAG TPA: hypothetical protein VE127_01265 [Solirubrobacteraceae bacterium]|nr:hypothetical protein [Solirubrobacteraceae bacterium]